MKRIFLAALALVCIVATVLTFGVISYAAEPDDTVVDGETTFYKYEAENGVLGGQAQNGGTNVGWLGGGGNGTVTITVTSDKAGLATIYVAYASEHTRSMAVTVNGKTKEFASLKTGSWSNFTEMSFTAELIKGENTIVIGGVGTGDAPNVDYILVSEVLELSDDPDAAIPNESLDTTLSPGDRDYVFYAQTRTNRLDSSKKDVRIVCVADQEWLSAAENFVATFTFSDGTTPITLKSVGIKTVFKAITAFGTEGKTETYTAAEGAVIFGWVITDVPADYANVMVNAPKATVSTDADAIPDSIVDVDYKTPVLVKDDINVETDGIYNRVETDINGKVGGMDHDGSRATYILSGNYEGIYKITVYYTDMDGRWIHVAVNGTEYSLKISDTTSDWNNIDTKKSFSFYVEMKKGANVVTFSRKNGAGPNLVDFDLERVSDLKEPAKAIVGSETPEGYTVEFENGARIDGTRFSFMDGADQKTHIFIDGMAAGEYMAKVYFCAGDDGRAITLGVNGEDATAHRVYSTGNNSWSDYSKV